MAPAPHAPVHRRYPNGSSAEVILRHVVMTETSIGVSRTAEREPAYAVIGPGRVGFKQGLPCCRHPLQPGHLYRFHATDHIAIAFRRHRERLRLERSGRRDADAFAAAALADSAAAHTRSHAGDDG